MDRTSTFFRLYRDRGVSRVSRLSRRTWVYPAALERTYARAVAKYLMKSTMEAISTALTYYQGSRSDALDLGSGSSPSAGVLLGIAKDVDRFNKGQWSMFQEIAIGDGWNPDESWVDPTLKRWSTEQVTLIKNSQGAIQDAVNRRVRDAVRKGDMVSTLKERLLQDLPGMSDRRAKLIARDQVAKLNGELTRGRMEDAGLETYRWETSMDERVRGPAENGAGGMYPDAVPAHTIMQGKICRWDNPSVYRDENGDWVPRPVTAPTNHPGMEIQCRCVAIPNWEELEDPNLGGEPVVEPDQPEDVPQEEPAPEVPPVPMPVQVMEDEIPVPVILSSAKAFREELETRFPSGTKGFKPGYYTAAQERLARLPVFVQKEYETTFQELRDVFSDKGKAYFSPTWNRVSVQGKKAAKDAKSYGSDLVHEVGHASDYRIGQKLGTKYASMYMHPKFQHLTLAEIVKRDMVDPIVQAVERERGESIRNAARFLLNDRNELLMEINKRAARFNTESESSRVRWAIYHYYNDRGRDDLAMMVYKLDPQSGAVLKALQDNDLGSMASALERPVNFNPRYSVYVDKFSPTLQSFINELKDVGDEAAVLGGVSDMFEAVTRKPGFISSWGHGVSYWLGNKENPGTEAWAEIMEMMGSPSPGASRIIEKYLKNARDYVLDLIKEATK